jgi:hypothetical protein
MMTAAAAAASGLGGASQQQPAAGQCVGAKPPCARVVPVPILSDNYAYLVIDVSFCCCCYVIVHICFGGVA